MAWPDRPRLRTDHSPQGGKSWTRKPLGEPQTSLSYRKDSNTTRGKGGKAAGRTVTPDPVTPPRSRSPAPRPRALHSSTPAPQPLSLSLHSWAPFTTRGCSEGHRTTAVHYQVPRPQAGLLSTTGSRHAMPVPRNLGRGQRGCGGQRGPGPAGPGRSLPSPGRRCGCRSRQSPPSLPVREGGRPARHMAHSRCC